MYINYQVHVCKKLIKINYVNQTHKSNILIYISFYILNMLELNKFHRSLSFNWLYSFDEKQNIRRKKKHKVDYNKI